MRNPSEGLTKEGLPWRRARLCDVFTGLDSTLWKWFLFNKKGEYLRSFATRRELEWHSANRGHLISPGNVTDYERAG